MAIVMNSAGFVSSRDRLIPRSGTGSWITGHTGHGSPEWCVTWVTHGSQNVTHDLDPIGLTAIGFSLYAMMTMAMTMDDRNVAKGWTLVHVPRHRRSIFVTAPLMF